MEKLKTLVVPPQYFELKKKSLKLTDNLFKQVAEARENKKTNFALLPTTPAHFVMDINKDTSKSLKNCYPVDGLMKAFGFQGALTINIHHIDEFNWEISPEYNARLNSQYWYSCNDWLNMKSLTLNNPSGDVKFTIRHNYNFNQGEPACFPLEELTINAHSVSLTLRNLKYLKKIHIKSLNKSFYGFDLSNLPALEEIDLSDITILRPSGYGSGFKDINPNCKIIFNPDTTITLGNINNYYKHHPLKEWFGSFYHQDNHYDTVKISKILGLPDHDKPFTTTYRELLSKSFAFANKQLLEYLEIDKNLDETLLKNHLQDLDQMNKLPKQKAHNR